MRRTRGQATVELALGGLLVISTVMLGLWLSEVSFLSIKVQEASAAAVWNATGRPVDDFNDPNDPSVTRRNHDGALTGAEQATTNRYRDFDAAAGGNNGTSMVFTQGKQLEVSCVETGPAGQLAFNLPASTAYDDGTATVPGQVNTVLRRWYQPRGAAMCTASAEVSAYRLPKSFADRADRGFFTRFREDEVLRLCGVGKAVGTGCSAAYPVLLGDWALDGPPGRPVVRDSVLPRGGQGPSGNLPYRSMVETLFEKSGERYDANRDGSGASGTMAARLGGQRAPGTGHGHRDRKFYFSYAGSEHGYGDMIEFRGDSNLSCTTCHFNTAGTSAVNGNPRPADPGDDWRSRRRPCFLGLAGCQ